MLNDHIVFKKIKEGDIRTFEDLFRKHYTSLCMYSFSITGRKDISEEVVQDVFYNIWKERENIQTPSSLKNYLFGAVKNHSLRYHNNLALQKRHSEYVQSNTNHDADMSPQELLEYKELENVVNNIIKKMPERRMKIFMMHRIDKKKYTEIANAYSVSVKTVEAELSKAYKTLRQGIEKYNK